MPFPTEITQLFLDKIDLMIKAMFKGTFVIAITQGLAMGLVLWLAGVPYVMFLTLASMFLALVPLVGVSWLPGRLESFNIEWQCLPGSFCHCCLSNFCRPN